MYHNNLVINQRLSVVPQYVQPNSGDTVAVTNSNVIIDPSASLAALTISLPPFPAGTQVSITSTKAVQAVTFAFGDYALNFTAPTGLTANTPIRLIAAQGQWFQH